VPSSQRSTLALLLAALAAALVVGAVALAVETPVAHRPVVLLAALAAAAVAGFVAGRRLARPIDELTAGAARLARGDLETPVAPAAAGRGPAWSEAAALGATMEEMRRRLYGLTAELRRRQGESDAVLAGISEGVFAVDRDRRIRYLNPQAAALLGIDPRDAASALGRFCGDVLNPRGPGGERPCDEACPIVHARFRGGARATEHLVLPSGARRAVVVTSSPPGGAAAPAFAPSPADRQFQVLRDETEVEAARRLRDAVLANVSHEFKTPLAAQLASIELLAERLAAADGAEGGGAGAARADVRELVRSLERGTLRLTQLVDNLLESVRIEAGEIGIRRRAVALDEVVEQAIELTAPLIGQRGQRLEVDLPYPLPAVSGDAPRLTQAMVNLLANANKFAPEGSTIRVGGAVEAAGVALWVEDEGPGLPDDPEGSLFDRFRRAPRASLDPLGPLGGDGEPEQSGVGLGLWIVKSIVERHGGRIDTLPGVGCDGGVGAAGGTRVRITLPRASAEDAA
jgi:signal transduction histidine kinase/HAMP domain-containing protein